VSLEETLRIWSQRPSASEQTRIDRTERMVRDAISKSSDPKIRAATIFAKGSVKMNTNIRANSDIDICIQAGNAFFTEYPANTNNAYFGNHSIEYTFQEFRCGIENALRDHFGYEDVDISGSKAIRVRKTISDSRIDADIVPAFEYRFYNINKSWLSGIEIKPKNNPTHSIINWPHHNYENSLAKHENTSRRYRKMVRIFKRIREAMKESNESFTHDAQSFLIESLLWNVPNEHFGNVHYTDDVANIINYLLQQLSSDLNVTEWGEVNEFKYLFRDQQKWSRDGALAFISNANLYLGALV